MAMTDGGQLMKIGEVAAQNIAAATGMTGHVKVIEQAIADEINAMSSHFTLAFADIQTQYEIDLKAIKSTYSFAKANWRNILKAAILVFLLGVGVGLLF